MTREEAITELSVIWERLSHPEDCENGCYSFRDGDYLEALDIAIEALSAEAVPLCDDCTRCAVKALNRPSAEAVQGEWIDVENEPFCECSVCGAYIDNLDSDYAFCPRCGARMKDGKIKRSQENIYRRAGNGRRGLRGNVRQSSGRPEGQRLRAG